MQLSRDGDVHILTLDRDENRIDLGFVEQMGEALDRVVGDGQERSALVTRAAGKFWSNGLRVDWLMAASRGDQVRFLQGFKALLGRLVSLPVPTVAALNGHAFAAGAILALAFDYRLMREDQGWICLPEVDVGVPFDPAMLALVRSKLPPATARDALLTGRRYTGAEAAAAGFVDACVASDRVLADSVELAAALAKKDRAHFAPIKTMLYADIAESFAAIEDEE